MGLCFLLSHLVHQPAVSDARPIIMCATAWLLDQVEPAIMGKGGEPTLHPLPTKYRPVHFPRLLAVVIVGAAKGWARDRNGRHLSTLLLARLPSFQLCLTWYLPSDGTFLLPLVPAVPCTLAHTLLEAVVLMANYYPRRKIPRAYRLALPQRPYLERR
ncbi:hypothetical protein BGZ61DRAFT_22282 [Ilyonectria robusta]|uniref:uncharacterized protein n=1 Tax=Ilyonectria robusta TaxID=1079257 RepID=UPI001E8D6E00|nr:uncharacterized protein BGZ61DRAFT_22282 [Ilyonectria robusta]KAH8737764.1 hypothetical protein BGZ61DRAFT_22282 [Ilyonectria robusta]